MSDRIVETRKTLTDTLVGHNIQCFIMRYLKSTISNIESPLNFQVKEKKILKSVKKQRN